MKKFWSLLATILILSPLGAAAADTVSVSQVIHITGTVPPLRYIIVDGQNNIKEITSNTPEAVEPQVRLDTFAGPQLPLTEALKQAYAAKTKGKDMHSLDMHVALPDPVAAKRTQPGMLSALGNLSFLRLR